MTGTLVTNDQYNSDVTEDGSYNALYRCAQEGFFAVSATYEGYGLSSHPEDGSSVTADRLLLEMGELVEWIRWRRWVRRVDLLGSSLGSTLAVALRCKQPHQSTQNRPIKIGQLQQRDVGRVVKDHFDQWNDSCGNDTGTDTSQKSKGPIP